MPGFIAGHPRLYSLRMDDAEPLQLTRVNQS
jgi:hypothetical protein